MKDSRLFTKEDFDAECKRLRLKDRPYKICDDDGLYHFSVIEQCLYKRGLVSVRIDDHIKFKFVMEMMRKYEHEFFLGIIALYENSGVRHFVTIIFKNKKYYIIDSESPSGDAYAVSNENDVYRYFGTDLVTAIGVNVK